MLAFGTLKLVSDGANGLSAHHQQQPRSGGAVWSQLGGARIRGHVPRSPVLVPLQRSAPAEVGGSELLANASIGRLKSKTWAVNSG
jgi:hypothetical protein